jgi:hypothetical protein
MKWKLVCAAAAVVVFGSLAMAETFPAIITSVKDGKVTFYKAKFNKEEKKLDKEGDALTLPAAEDVKVAKGKFSKEDKKFVAGDAIDGGLKHEMFEKISDKGITASITTDADNKKITEILTFGGKKKN